MLIPALSGGGDGRRLPDVNHAGVPDDIPSGLVGHGPEDAGALGLTGDVPQAVSRPRRPAAPELRMRAGVYVEDSAG